MHGPHQPVRHAGSGTFRPYLCTLKFSREGLARLADRDACWRSPGGLTVRNRPGGPCRYSTRLGFDRSVRRAGGRHAHWQRSLTVPGTAGKALYCTRHGEMTSPGILKCPAHGMERTGRNPALVEQRYVFAGEGLRGAPATALLSGVNTIDGRATSAERRRPVRNPIGVDRPRLGCQTCDPWYGSRSGASA